MSAIDIGRRHEGFPSSSVFFTGVCCGATFDETSVPPLGKGGTSGGLKRLQDDPGASVKASKPSPL